MDYFHSAGFYLYTFNRTDRSMLWVSGCEKFLQCFQLCLNCLFNKTGKSKIDGVVHKVLRLKLKILDKQNLCL